jgi:hypothetical protein
MVYQEEQDERVWADWQKEIVEEEAGLLRELKAFEYRKFEDELEKEVWKSYPGFITIGSALLAATIALNSWVAPNYKDVTGRYIGVESGRAKIELRESPGARQRGARPFEDFPVEENVALEKNKVYTFDYEDGKATNFSEIPGIDIRELLLYLFIPPYLIAIISGIIIIEDVVGGEKRKQK